MDAKVTFTPEFKNKTKKKLSAERKKELRYQCLADAEKNGKLDKAKSRYDVAKLAGFTDKQRQSGYQWVYHQVKDGFIKEYISGYTKNGLAEYEYHLAEPKKREPYTVSGVAPDTKLVAKEEPIILSRAYEPNAHPKVTIKLARIELVLEDMPLKDIAALAHTFDKEA